MKVKAIFAFLLCASALTVGAKNVLKDASKAICRITTYRGDSLMATGNGFFYTETGRVAASFDLFDGATRATVTNYKGQTFNVTRIAGASDTYNLVTALTDCRKPNYLPLSATAAFDADSTAQMVRFGGKGKAEQARVTTSVPLYSYRYYTFSLPNDSAFIGLPLVNEAGEAVAVLQRNYSTEATGICGLDARVAASLKTSSVSFGDASLNSIGIAKLLPESESEALSYLYLFTERSADSLQCETLFADFMAQYPDNIDARTEYANFQARHGNYALADRAMADALERAGKEGAPGVHYAYSKLLLSYTHFPVKRAIEEAEKAYSLRPDPLYLQQVGACQLADKQYEAAYATYTKVNQTSLASAQTFLSAAQSLMALKRDTTTIIALLDSAVARTPQPYPQSSVGLFFFRAGYLFATGQYRKAVFDYNEIEKIYAYKNMTPYFYLLRSRAEQEAHMYQQGLDDLERVIGMQPDNFDVRLEKAALLLRAGETRRALEAALDAYKRNPKSAGACRLLGIAYAESGNKAQAAKHFNEAVALGDSSAAELLKAYR